ncbi:MAG: tail fiber domain-containing protein [Thiotrichales bacterium]|nr:tail fiber domain-containing protein [Thiotrichales bacterium]
MPGGGGGGSGGSGRQESREARRLYATQAKISREMWDAFRSRGLPAIDKFSTNVDQLAGHIKDMDSPERIAHEQGLAGVDVEQAYGKQRRGLTNMLGRYGMRPGSGRFTSALRSLALGQAADTAGAKTRARTGVLDRALNARFGLADAYRSVASTASGLGGAAISGLGAAAGGIAGIGANKAQQKGAMWGGIGSLVGSLGGASLLGMSDRALKRNIEPIDVLPNGLIVYSFTYIDDPETEYTGLMADEVARVMPEHVGSYGGYATVDYAGVLRELLADELSEAA